MNAVMCRGIAGVMVSATYSNFKGMLPNFWLSVSEFLRPRHPRLSQGALDIAVWSGGLDFYLTPSPMDVPFLGGWEAHGKWFLISKPKYDLYAWSYSGSRECAHYSPIQFWRFSSPYTVSNACSTRNILSHQRTRLSQKHQASLQLFIVTQNKILHRNPQSTWLLSFPIHRPAPEF